MKLYRVVPNIFSSGERINSNGIPNVEAIYYDMGYASFSGNIGMHKYNTVFSKDEEIPEGKYFFPFVEDAIRQGYYLLTNSHKLRDVGTFYILEYDFPENIALKHFGFGDYRDDSGLSSPLMEFYVEKADFLTGQSKILLPNQISSDDKENVLVKMFSITLKDAEKHGGIDLQWYGQYCYDNYLSFSDFVNNPDEIKSIINECYLWFPSEGNLIQSEYLTGKIITINTPAVMGQYRNWELASEYFNTLGVGVVDFSREQDEFKREIISASGCDSLGKDVVRVKKLLREKNYL